MTDVSTSVPDERSKISIEVVLKARIEHLMTKEGRRDGHDLWLRADESHIIFLKL